MMPTARSLISRVFAPLVRAVEGAVRPGPWPLPVSGGMLTSGPPSYGEYYNWFQLGGVRVGNGRSAMLEACVAAYSQTIAMCAGAANHWRIGDDGGRKPITTNALSRVLRNPNGYQTSSEFWMDATRSLYSDGNTYALALRNDRFEIDELHLFDPARSRPMLAADGSIFYRLAGNNVIEAMLGNSDIIVPQRDVMQIRLAVNKMSPTPLIGEPPMLAALDDWATYQSIRQQQEDFYRNSARPSAVITTDLQLDAAQTQSLRDRWNAQAKSLHQGGTPILGSGLKVQPWPQAPPAKDMAVIELMRASQDQIALAFRVPLPILGVSVGSTYGANAELIRSWLSLGLGFALNHIEVAIEKCFGLGGLAVGDYVELSTDPLMRSDPKDAAEMMARRVSSGVYSVNEARKIEQLPRVAYGDEPRLQAQQVPLSQVSLAAVPSAPVAPVGEKAYAEAVQRDLAALASRSTRRSPERAARPRHGLQSASQEQRQVIRKTRRDALITRASGG